MATYPNLPPDHPVCCPDYECKWSGTADQAHGEPDNLLQCPVCECPVVTKKLHAPCKVPCCERFGLIGEHDLRAKGTGWFIHDEYGGIMIHDISFCPFCGKKLEAPA